MDWDGPKDDLDIKHVFYTPRCMPIMSNSFDRKLILKLDEFVDSGIDIDKLPGDLKLFVIVHMTVEEARELTAY